jgi:hypothetical protein
MDEKVEVVRPIETPKNNSGLIYGLVVLLAILAPVAVILGFGYMRRPDNVVGGGNVTPTPSPRIASAKNFVNCADVRDTVELGGLRYFGCLGGIIGVDGQGNVKDQYDMSGGLPSYTVTGLQIWKNKLVASTQNGIALIDIDTKDIKRISVQEGLNEGSNATVKIDGDVAWVGTFDGASRVDLTTYEVTNYLAPQFGLGTVFNVGSVMVTPRAVYMVNLASAYASGGVVRYLKSTNEFQVFRASDFGSTTNRVDLFGIAMSGNNVVLSDMRNIFVFDDTKTDGPRKVDPSIFDKFAEQGQSRLVRIVGESDGGVILFVSGTTKRSFVKFDAVTGLATRFMDIDKGSYDLPFALRDGKMWYRDMTDFVSAVDLKTAETTKITLKNRPVSFTDFAAKINGLVYLYGSGYLWHYDPTQGMVKDAQVMDIPITDMSDMATFAFAPIPGTNKISMYRQTCGQGCERPELWIVDYPKFEVTKLDLPEKMIKGDDVQPGPLDDTYSYPSMRFAGIESGKVVLDYEGVERDSWFFDPISSSWLTMKRLVPSNMLLTAKCQQDFQFVDGKFVPAACDANAASKYTLTVGTNAVLTYDDNGNKETFNLPKMWADYIPKSFSEFGWEAGKPVYFDKKVFMPTSRGVAVFDIVSKSITAYGPQNGMLGNRSNSVMVDDNMIYSIANWGGFSAFLR